MKRHYCGRIGPSMMLLLCGCADFTRWVRQYTYPPEFRYIESHELRSEMPQLASHSRAINQLCNLAMALRSTGRRSMRTLKP
jgi:hypothetical protein